MDGERINRIWHLIADLMLEGRDLGDGAQMYRRAVVERCRDRKTGALVRLERDAQADGLDLTDMQYAVALRPRTPMDLGDLLRVESVDAQQQASQALAVKAARARLAGGLPPAPEGKLAPETKALGRSQVAAVRQQLTKDSSDAQKG